MTNASPENPQPTEPTEPTSYTPEEVQRIRRNTRAKATQEVTDEWIAVIVAFGTIGAILFWSLGGNKSKLPSLSQNNFFTSSEETTETTANANLDLDSQDVVATENSDNLNIATTSDNTQLDSNVASGSLSITKDNLNQNNNFVSSVPLIASTPSVTKAITPKPVPEVDTTELESAPEASPIAPEVTPIEPEADTSPTSEAEAEAEANPDAIAFSQLSDQHWAYPFISKLGEENLLPNAQGFKPDDPINRAEMASLISSAFKSSPQIEAPIQFTDVPAGSNQITDINKAVALGFMNGYSEGDFRPEQIIPRYQVLVSLATGLNLEPSGDTDTILQNFSDREELPEWSLDQVAAATEAGLAVNRPDLSLNSLDPNEPATRAEVAAMIYQTLATSGTVPPIESEYIVPKP